MRIEAEPKAARELMERIKELKDNGRSPAIVIDFYKIPACAVIIHMPARVLPADGVKEGYVEVGEFRGASVFVDERIAKLLDKLRIVVVGDLMGEGPVVELDYQTYAKLSELV